MKVGKWIVGVLVPTLVVALLLTTNGYAEDNNKGRPKQIAELQATILSLKQMVTSQQKEIDSLKKNIAKGQESERKIATLKVKVIVENVSVFPWELRPISGQKIIIMDSIGKQYSGVTNVNGEAIFNVPAGLYTARLDKDLTGYFGEAWTAANTVVPTSPEQSNEITFSIQVDK